MLVGRGGGTVASVSEVLYLGTYCVSAGGGTGSVLAIAPFSGCTKLWLQPVLPLAAQRNLGLDPYRGVGGAPRQ